MSDTKPKPSMISLLFGVPEVRPAQDNASAMRALARRRQAQAACMQVPRTRICAAEGCDKPLVRREGENGAAFAGRLYCSRTCRGVANGKRLSHRWAVLAAQRPKTCDECGQQFVKKPRESWTWFSQRRRCRPDCDGTADMAATADET